MYLRAKPSTSFNTENYSIEDVANMIRELIKSITTENFDKTMLNPAVYDPEASAILDPNYNGWTLATSTRDGTTLGSGAGLSEVGDIWVVTNGSKNIELSIIHRTHLGENYHISFAPAVGADHDYWLDPRNQATIITDNTGSLTIGEWFKNTYKTY
jgi:hypothetical protein